jgi:hypothetical protein
MKISEPEFSFAVLLSSHRRSTEDQTCAQIAQRIFRRHCINDNLDAPASRYESARRFASKLGNGAPRRRAKSDDSSESKKRIE